MIYSRYLNKNSIFKLLLLSVFLVVRLVDLGSDISNTDAYRWHTRSDNFLHAIKTFDFKNTYQHYQPGVTLMWINAFYKQLSFSVHYHLLKDSTPPTLNNYNEFTEIHGQSKALIVFILFILFTVQLNIIEKLFNQKVSLLYALFMTTEPYLIGIDRWFHVTSLEAYFAFTSFLLILIWIKENNWKYFILSSIAIAFAVLSKITSIVLVIPLIYVLYSKKSMKIIVKYLLLVLVFIVLFFPAFWVDFYNVTRSLFVASKSALQVEHYQSPLPVTVKLLFYDIILLLKSSAVLIISFIMSICSISKLAKNKTYIYSLLYFFTYYLVLFLSAKKIDRYIVPMILPMIFISSLYLSNISKKILNLVVGIILAYFVFSTFIYFPNYSAFYSLGTKTAISWGVYDNSGEYFSEAARYLNKYGRDNTVYIPNGAASFKYYYGGSITDGQKSDYDYYVTSLDQDRKITLLDKCLILENYFGSKEQKVVFVYSCNSN